MGYQIKGYTAGVPVKMNMFAIKNYISVFITRLTAGEAISPAEYISFLGTVNDTVDSIDERISGLEDSIEALQDRTPTPKNQSMDGFVAMVMSKIDILKNIIKKKLGNPSEGMFSFNMTTVEAIEKEILDSGTVTKENLEKLNQIYIAEKSKI